MWSGFSWNLWMVLPLWRVENAMKTNNKRTINGKIGTFFLFHFIFCIALKGVIGSLTLTYILCFFDEKLWLRKLKFEEWFDVSFRSLNIPNTIHLNLDTSTTIIMKKIKYFFPFLFIKNILVKNLNHIYQLLLTQILYMNMIGGSILI